MNPVTKLLLRGIALNLSNHWYESFETFYKVKDNMKPYGLFCKMHGIIAYDRTMRGLFADGSDGLVDYLEGKQYTIRTDHHGDNCEI